MKHKKLLIVAVVLALIAIIAGTVFIVYYDVKLPFIAKTDGKCGKSLTWSLEGEETLKIDGSGSMIEYEDYFLSVPWEDFDNVNKLVIGKDVSKLDLYAISYLKNLTKIEVDNQNASYIVENNTLYDLGKTVLIRYANETIEKDFTIPQSVKAIEMYAFINSGLEKISLTNQINFIQKGAFKNCYNLKSITIPESVTIIEAECFYGCSSLTKINLHDSINTIGDSAFKNCTDLESVTVPKSVSNFGKAVFDSCSSLKSAVINAELISIPDATFQDCYNLKHFVIPESVTEIESNSFRSSAIETITIPKNVDTISQFAFFKCKNIVAFEVDDENTSFCSQDGVLFDKEMTTLIIYPCGKTSMQYSVNSTVKTIKSYAFYSCVYLSQLTVGENVETIEPSAIVYCNGVTILCFKKSDIYDYAKEKNLEFRLLY